jgi:hypothetical protein
MLISFGYFAKCDTKFDHLVLRSFVADQMMPIILKVNLLYVVTSKRLHCLLIDFSEQTARAF